MKFKIGDRVVVHRLESDAGTKLKDFLGEVVTISDVADGVLGDYPYYIEGHHGISFGENELEFEHVYNSPLYKALS